MSVAVFPWNVIFKNRWQTGLGPQAFIQWPLILMNLKFSSSAPSGTSPGWAGCRGNPDNLQEEPGVICLNCPEMEMLTLPAELLQWATEAVGRPDRSSPKFRAMEMEMLSIRRSKVPCRMLVGRNESQMVDNQPSPRRGAGTQTQVCLRVPC